MYAVQTMQSITVRLLRLVAGFILLNVAVLTVFAIVAVGLALTH